jgi:hypothetical protein
MQYFADEEAIWKAYTGLPEIMPTSEEQNGYVGTRSGIVNSKSVVQLSCGCIPTADNGQQI